LTRAKFFWALALGLVQWQIDPEELKLSQERLARYYYKILIGNTLKEENFAMKIFFVDAD